MFGFNWAPTGWALCSGQLISIATNTALFSLLGTTYGGDGRTNFGLPDLRGRVPVSQGDGIGLESIRLGEMEGSNSVQISNQNLPKHSHSLENNGIAYNLEEPEEGGNALSNPTLNEEESEHKISLTNNKTGDTGNGNPLHNMQPYLGLNFCIALVGLYPSRP
jgi:microcystin-dependent protein